jgi:hypothetical protein
MRPPIHPVFPPKMSTFVIGVGSDMITVVSGKYGASGRGGGSDGSTSRLFYEL